jgi:DMSO/TMAO reductase YedYZ molybdopterin-dependent catalytic subunit
MSEPSRVEPSRVEPSHTESPRIEPSSNKLSRRKLITAGLTAAAGVAGLGVAAELAQKFGLIPPDHGGIWGLGETLTYASQRLLTRHSLAREFSRSQISKPPFPNEMAPPSDEFKRLQAGGFAEWRLSVNGMVARPATFSLDQLKSYPAHSQITMLQCEEGWSYIAEWIGVPLSQILQAVEVHPQARYVVYFSIERDWWDSIDMADALHPQTFLVYGMNGDALSVGNGGPLRLRVPRQIGYKSVKFVTHMTVTDNLKTFGKGLGSASPEGGYAWYAGI